MAEQQIAVQAEALKIQEQAKKQAEAQAAAQREAAKPENKLLAAYDLLHRVQYCRQVRDGYLVINISEPEYDRAIIAVKAIEKMALQAVPNLNTDDLWKQGEQRMYRDRSTWYNNYTCKEFLQDLYKMSPTSVYHYAKP